MMPYNREELAQTLFEESSDALFLFDPQTEQLVDVNPMSQRLSGFTRAELLQMQVTYIFRSEVKGGLQRLRLALGKTSFFHSQEGFYLRNKAGGVWIPVNISIARLHLKPRTLGLITARDIREQREHHAHLKKMEAGLRRVLSSVSDYVWSVELDSSGQFVQSYHSPVVEKVTGRPPEFYAAAMDRWFDIIDPEHRPKVTEAFRQLRQSIVPAVELEYRIVWPDGSLRWVRNSMVASQSNDSDRLRIYGVVTDISERKQTEALLAAEKQVLELIATGAPLPEVLRVLSLSMEEQSQGMLCSILLLDPDTHQLQCGAGPNLPDAYNQAINGVAVGPSVGSCGTAAYLGRKIVVEDIATDPLWAEYRDLALAHGLRACWSSPIFSTSGSVLGTFAIYYRQPRRPDSADLRLIERATHLAGIAIERKRTEEGLRNSEDRYRAFVEQSAEGIWRIELDQPISVDLPEDEQLEAFYHYAYLAECNDTFARTFGYAHARDLVGARLSKLLARSDARNENVMLSFIRSQYRLVAAESYESDRSGQSRVFQNNLVGTVEDGKVLRAWGTQRDITERKHMLEALKESETRLRALFDNSKQSFILVDRQHNIRAFNRVASELSHAFFGWDIREGASIASYFRVPGAEAFQECFALALTGQSRTVELELMGCGGAPHWFEFSWSPVIDESNQITGICFCGMSIDERKKAAEALTKSEARFRSLVQNSSDIITIVEASGTIRYMSPSFERILGYPQELCIGRNIVEYIHPEDRAAIWAVFSYRTQTPGVGAARECRLRHADGSWVHFEGVGNNLLDDPHIRGMVVHARDITERKRAAEALAHQHSFLRRLIDSIPDLIFYKDCKGDYLGCNAAFEKYIGRSEADLVGLSDLDLAPRERALSYQEKERQALAEGSPQRTEEWIEYADQRRALLEVLKTPFFDLGGRPLGLIGIARDITERRRLEEQLRQTGKMEAIGQLAGGVAHDFNNLLTVIVGNVSLLRMASPAEGSEAQLLSETQTAALRAAELTSKLLGFSRRTTLRLEPSNLNTFVQETVALLRRTIDPRINVEIRCAPDLWTVNTDPSQLNQVLMNLCLNARDAMATGGRLLLETANVTLDENFARLRLEARPGEFIRLRVEDTGHGIAPEIKQRIFEPFFTTKGPGKGTGLGLAMVFGIVKQHEGWIDCYSEVDQGTRFDIYLPRYCVPHETAATCAPAQLPCSGHETILLVDDEPMIRNLGRAILERYGYQVVLAEDGQQAVDIYRHGPESIDLVILDLTMPRLSGHDAFRQLLQLDPDVRVLFASGYSAEHVSEADHERLLGFVGKPYQPQDLARTVRSALDRAGQRNRAPASV
ncbi:MAG TPA: PAS domain S-box protein [Gemmataceae bacterium]|nr:PAS domain S-box protein [Gemmataceae bacterium]